MLFEYAINPFGGMRYAEEAAGDEAISESIISMGLLPADGSSVEFLFSLSETEQSVAALLRLVSSLIQMDSFTATSGLCHLYVGSFSGAGGCPMVYLGLMGASV